MCDDNVMCSEGVNYLAQSRKPYGAALERIVGSYGSPKIYDTERSAANPDYRA